MPLYEIDGIAPTLGEGAWVAPSADLIGDVRLGARASIWFGAVIRADNTPILIRMTYRLQPLEGGRRTRLTVTMRLEMKRMPRFVLRQMCKVMLGAKVGAMARTLRELLARGSETAATGEAAPDRASGGTGNRVRAGSAASRKNPSDCRSPGCCAKATDAMAAKIVITAVERAMEHLLTSQTAQP